MSDIEKSFGLVDNKEAGVKSRFTELSEEVTRCYLSLGERIGGFETELGRCLKVTERLNDLLKAFESKSDLVMSTMDRVDESMRRLADESREKIAAISDVVGTNQDGLNKRAMRWDGRLDSLEGRLNDLDRWRSSKLVAEFEKVKDSLTELMRFRVETDAALVKVNAHKADKKATENLLDEVHQVFHDFEVKMEHLEKNQQILEHYTERYVPAQIQNMIIENMQPVLTVD